MLADPMETADWRGRKAREFNPPSALLAGEVAECRRPMRWGRILFDAVVCLSAIGLVVVTLSIIGA